MKQNEKILAEEEKLSGQLLDDEALDDISGGTSKGNVTTAVLRSAGEGVKLATTAVQRTIGAAQGTQNATTAVQRTPIGARDKDVDTTSTTGRSHRIISC